MLVPNDYQNDPHGSFRDRAFRGRGMVPRDLGTGSAASGGLERRGFDALRGA